MVSLRVTWEATATTTRRQLLRTDPETAPHAQGVLIVEETGDRQDGDKTAHVGRQDLGVLGKTDTGLVAVSPLWAAARVYAPLHPVPYTPAARLPRGKQDPAFRTKPRRALRLVEAARAAGVPFRAAGADGCYAAPGTTSTSSILRIKYTTEV